MINKTLFSSLNPFLFSVDKYRVISFIWNKWDILCEYKLIPIISGFRKNTLALEKLI